MKLGTVTQQPAERFSYTISYADALSAGDNVKDVVGTVIPATGLVLDNVIPLDPRIKFWVGAVDADDTVGIYTVELTVTSEDGQIFQDEIKFRIKEYT